MRLPAALFAAALLIFAIPAEAQDSNPVAVCLNAAPHRVDDCRAIGRCVEERQPALKQMVREGSTASLEAMADILVREYESLLGVIVLGTERRIPVSVAKSMLSCRNPEGTR